MARFTVAEDEEKDQERKDLASLQSRVTPLSQVELERLELQPTPPLPKRQRVLGTAADVFAGLGQIFGSRAPAPRVVANLREEAEERHLGRERVRLAGIQQKNELRIADARLGAEEASRERLQIAAEQRGERIDIRDEARAERREEADRDRLVRELNARLGADAQALPETLTESDRLSVFAASSSALRRKDLTIESQRLLDEAEEKGTVGEEGLLVNEIDSSFPGFRQLIHDANERALTRAETARRGGNTLDGIIKLAMQFGASGTPLSELVEVHPWLPNHPGWDRVQATYAVGGAMGANDAWQASVEGIEQTEINPDLVTDPRSGLSINLRTQQRDGMATIENRLRNFVKLYGPSLKSIRRSPEEAVAMFTDEMNELAEQHDRRKQVIEGVEPLDPELIESARGVDLDYLAALARFLRNGYPGVEFALSKAYLGQTLGEVESDVPIPTGPGVMERLMGGTLGKVINATSRGVSKGVEGIQSLIQSLLDPASREQLKSDPKALGQAIQQAKVAVAQEPSRPLSAEPQNDEIVRKVLQEVSARDPLAWTRFLELSLQDPSILRAIEPTRPNVPRSR